MSATKAHIIAQLQKEILPLQGYKAPAKNADFQSGLGPIRYAFPNAQFPTGAVHEFLCEKPEDLSATNGFIAGILSSLMVNSGVLLWIGQGLVFPPALKAFGIRPDHVIFIKVKGQREKLWAMEEALKCEGLAAVIGEIQELTFTLSRRLQLAVEQSRVTGFVVRQNPKNLITACVARWQVKPVATEVSELPGVGFPKWNVELLKVRNGHPGTWQVQWADGRFKHPYKLAAIDKHEHRKAV